MTSVVLTYLLCVHDIRQLGESVISRIKLVDQSRTLLFVMKLTCSDEADDLYRSCLARIVTSFTFPTLACFVIAARFVTYNVSFSLHSLTMLFAIFCNVTRPTVYFGCEFDIIIFSLPTHDAALPLNCNLARLTFLKVLLCTFLTECTIHCHLMALATYRHAQYTTINNSSGITTGATTKYCRSFNRGYWWYLVLHLLYG